MGKFWAKRLLLSGCLMGLASIAAPSLAETPPGRLPFVSYGTELGFGRWNVSSIAQDRDGLLWVGSDHGLFRYDGHRFQQIVVLDDLNSQIIEGLSVDREGTLWCVTSTGAAGLYEGRFRAVGEAEGLEGVARAIASDQEGRVFIGTERGLFRRDDKMRFERVSGFPEGTAKLLWLDPSGDLFVGGEGVLHRLSRDGHVRSWGETEGLPHESFTGVARDLGGRVWLSSGRRLLMLPSEDGVFEEKKGVVEHRSLMGMSLDHQGMVWVASSRGLIRIGEDGVPREEPGTPAGRAGVVFEDREGSLWVGGLGLHRAAGKGTWRVYGDKEGLPSETLWGVRRDARGGLWVGTSKGLARASEEGFRAVEVLPKTTLSAIAPSPDGTLWIGGVSPEVFHYDPSTERVDRFGLPGSPGNEFIHKLVFDREGTLWVGTTFGVFKGVPKDGVIELEQVAVHETKARYEVQDILLDTRGRLWFGTDLGLVVREEGIYRRFSTPDGFRGPHMSFLVERKNGQICVAYSEAPGVSCFRYEDHTPSDFVHFDTNHGLTSDVVYQLGEDQKGRLWIGSGKGADVVVGEEVVMTYDSTNGLPGDDCDGWAFYSDTNGDVWVGTSSGLGRFLANSEIKPPPPPEARLLSARTNEEELPLQSGAHLSHWQNTLSFEVAVPSYTNESQIEREIRLWGLDNDWRREGQGQAVYARLPPGRYTLEARARYRHGEWGQVTSFAFVIDRPWWQSLWFRLGAGFAVLALGGVVSSWQKRALRLRNEELLRLVAERTSALEEAQQQLLRLEKESTEQQMAGGFAHEMRNALTGARLLLGAVRKGEEESLCVDNSTRLGEIFVTLKPHVPMDVRRRVAGMLKTVNGNEARLHDALGDIDAALERALGVTGLLLEYARLGREEKGDSEVELSSLCNAIVGESRGDFESRGISVELEIEEGLVLRGREVHFYSILKNLVLNARDAISEKKEREGERRIRIEARREGEWVLIRVEDTGAGIEADKLKKIFEPFFSTKARSGTGLGLGVVDKLVRLYEGSIEVESERGRGTRFLLRFPAG